MSVKIRFAKIGKKHQVSYRIVAQDTKTKRDGKFLENIGFYNPHNKSQNFKIKMDRLESWVLKGAKLTEAVAKLIKIKKDMEISKTRDNSPKPQSGVPKA